MKVRYEWRRLMGDGLLMRPPVAGPYYDEMDVNLSGGYDSVEEAVAAYEAFDQQHEYAESELVLISIYQAR